MKALALVLVLCGQYANPKPLETAVRLHAGNDWGSGTVIYSDSATTLILSCAHVFRRSVGKPIVAEFWGANRGLGTEAKLISWDPERDLSLLAAQPGRQLPASRIAPKSWHPQPRYRMHVVGCALGREPTLYTTWIIRPRVELRLIETAYTGIETSQQPARGRSGGGLFTTDYYVAGVCNFGNDGIGIFADPTAIHAMLDRQGLSGLYTLPAHDPGLVECQAQVRRRFGLFAGIVGRRGAIGTYVGPRPDVAPNCIGGVCPAPTPTPTVPVPSPVDPTPTSPIVTPPTPTPPAVDLSAIEHRLAILEARSMMPIRVGVTRPDGTSEVRDNLPDYHPNSPHQSNPQYRGRIGIDLSSKPQSTGKP